ncbi:hypothetical protein SLS56_009090 [Neofusicoccum ribis]|uniref:Histone H1 n=1 Tax=Neofusicoccum ribis TaxID=45134 RepID=A0ABR3SIB7_9PEZI
MAPRTRSQSGITTTRVITYPEAPALARAKEAKVTPGKTSLKKKAGPLKSNKANTSKPRDKVTKSKRAKKSAKNTALAKMAAKKAAVPAAATTKQPAAKKSRTKRASATNK